MNPSSANCCTECQTPFERDEPFLVYEGRPHCRPCNDELRPICPYCRHPFKVKPKSLDDCPSCKHPIHTNRFQILYSTLLLTRQQYDFCSRVERVIAPLKPFGVNQRDFVIAQDELTDDRGSTPSDQDIQWKLFNTAAERMEDPAELAALYYEEARFFYRHNRNPVNLLHKARFNRLQDLKRQGVKRIRIMGPIDECTVCRQHGNTVLDIDDAIRHQTVPFQDCPYHHPDMTDDAKGAPCVYPFCEADYEGVQVTAPLAANKLQSSPALSPAELAVAKYESAARSSPALAPFADIDDDEEEVDEEIAQTMADASQARRNGNGNMMYLIDGVWVDEYRVPVPVVFISKGAHKGVWIYREGNAKGRNAYRKVPRQQLEKMIADVFAADPVLAERRKHDPAALQDIWHAVEGAIMLGSLGDDDTVE